MKKLIQLSPVRILFLLFTILPFACEPEAEPELNKEEVLKANAEFNNTIFPGVGNVSYEEKLVPNTLSQLVAKIAYKEDTIAFFGKINSTGQLEYIHTSIVAKQGGKELYVTEIFPDEQTSRHYTITDNVKSRFVIESEFSGNTMVSVSLLDLDWATGKSKTLKSYFVKEGQKIGEYTRARISKQLDIWNCDKAKSDEDISKEVGNHLQYFACGGLAYDTHQSLIALKASIIAGVEAIKAIEEYKGFSEEIDKLKEGFDNSNIINSIIDGVSNYKFEKSRLASMLKKLEELYKILKGQMVEVLIIPFDVASDLNYDEYTDDEIKITFRLEEKSSGKAYTDKPVYVDLALVIPGTNNALYTNTIPSNPINGLVVFKIDPLKIDKIKDHAKLLARYSFSVNNWNPSRNKDVTLKFNDPDKVEIVSGNNQSGKPAEKLPKPLKVKITDDLGRELPEIEVEWRIKKGDGSIISDPKTNFQGVAESRWTLGREEEQEVEVKVKRINGTFVNGAPLIFKASVSDSIAYYNSIMPGTWKASGSDIGISFISDFTGKYGSDNTLWKIKKDSSYKNKSGSDYVLLVRHLGTRRTYLYGIKDKGNLLFLNAFLDYNF